MGYARVMDFALEDALVMLARTPAVLRALLRGLPDEWTRANYGPRTWSAAEVLGHFIHTEREDWIPRARHLLERGDSSPFPPFDRNGGAPLMSKALDELLDIFARERDANIATLRSLVRDERDLEREGVHPALGPVTMRNLLATWVVHDFNHIAQMCKAMAYQYKSEVGPWEAYLSVLAPPNPR